MTYNDLPRVKPFAVMLRLPYPEGADDMRKSHFTDAQVIEMIEEQEAGMAMTEICRKAGIHRLAGSCAA